MGAPLPSSRHVCNPATFACQVDLAPTMLGMAGIPTPSYMDGKSIVPVIVEPTLSVSNAASIPGSVLKHLHEAGAPPQRVASFHEYYNQVNIRTKPLKCSKWHPVAVCVVFVY